MPKNNRNIDISNLTINKIDNSNFEEAWNCFISLTEGENISFSPSLEYWEKWCDTFPTYLVYQNNIKIGIFSYKTTELLLQYFLLKYAGNIFCIGKQPQTFNSMIYICKKYFNLFVH